MDNDRYCDEELNTSPIFVLSGDLGYARKDKVSYSNDNVCATEEPGAKRKRVGTPPEPMAKEVVIFEGILSELTACSDALVDLMNKHTKTQKDMKEKISLLQRTMKRMKRGSEDILRLVKPVDVSTKNVPTTRTFGTQVDQETIDNDVELKRKEECERISKQLKTTMGWIDQKEIIDLHWPEECFKNTSICNSLDSWREVDGDMAIMLDPRYALEGREVEEVKMSFPDITNLFREEITDGDIEFIKRNVETIASKGGRGESSSTLFVIPLCPGDEQVSDAEKAYNIFLKLKQEALIHQSNKIKVITTNSIAEQYIRKCAEIAFHNSEVRITVFCKNSNREKLKSFRSDKRKPETEKIVVKSTGRNYAEALKEIKDSVNIDKIGVQVRTIKRNNKGDIVMEVKGGRNRAEALKEAIMENSKRQVVMANNASILYISDIDADVGTSDIKKAILEADNRFKEDDVRSISTRPSRNGNLNATVSLSKFACRELARMGSVKIGWVFCKVRERVNITRCFKCLEFGHITRNCQGPDKSKICINCGREGHVKRDCTHDSYCTNCKVIGHRADQTRCPIFRQMINDKAKNSNKDRL